LGHIEIVRVDPGIRALDGRARRGCGLVFIGKYGIASEIFRGKIRPFAERFAGQASIFL
jgi:hypothetical protein